MTSPDDLLVDASEAAARAPRLTPPPVGDGSRMDLVPEQPTPAADDGGEGAEPPIAPPKEFDERWREPFQGLLYLGELTESFTLFGHRFKIVTPSQLTRLEIGPIHAPFNATLTAEIAFETIMVAAYLQMIDDQPLPLPIFNNDKDSGLRARYEWVVENLRRPVISQLYNRCLALEEEVDKVLEAMGEASG